MIRTTRPAVALLLWLAAGCHDPAPPPRQAILVLLDAARADRFSAYGYRRETTPHLDRLAARGLLFTHVFAQATYTRAALPSLLFSRWFARPLFPESASVPLATPDELFRTADGESISLPRALEAAGFRTAAISAHTWLGRGTEFAAEFGELHDLSTELRYPARYHAPRAEQVVDFAADWIARHRHEDFFLYLHLMDTHFPHFLDDDARAFLPPGAAAAAVGFDAEGRPRDPAAALDGPARAYLDALYDGSLRYADRQLGRLFARLDALGLLQHVVLVITSDHGEGLCEQPNRFGHGGEWYDVRAHIPFIVYAPGRVTPGRSDVLGEHVDVAPTLLALLDVAPPAGRAMDGHDLVAAARGAAPAKTHVFSDGGVRSRTHKALFPGGDVAFEAPLAALDGALFDLRADPAERTNLWRAQPEVAAELLAVYRARLGPARERYRSAVGGAQPRSAFAIASRDFALASPVAAVEGRVPFRELLDRARPAAWLRSGHALRHALLARGGAPPLDLEVALPNGSYAVTMSARGALAVGLQGAAPAPVATGLDGPPRSLDDTARVALGTIAVSDQRARARLVPPADPAAWVLVRTLGFEPIAAAGTLDAEAAREREERLRGLGYVE